LDRIDAAIPEHYFTQSILPTINLLYTYEDTDAGRKLGDDGHDHGVYARELMHVLKIVPLRVQADAESRSRILSLLVSN
jgi:hypothetical protein